MKNNNVKKGIFTALLLASPFVTAGVKYPAADFQPTVVYQDKNYQHEGASSASSASFGETAKADSNYPAATFKPEVLYHDKGYKHSASIEKAKSIPLAMWTEKAEEVATAEQASADAATGEGSAVNPLFAIVILAVAAFLFRQKSAGGSAKNRAGSSASGSDGLTGVAKYLQSKAPKLSGVAKYLEANQPTPKSGVAKYVAKKVVAAKKAAAENVSSVEKYVRRQG